MLSSICGARQRKEVKLLQKGEETSKQGKNGALKFKQLN